MIENNNGVIKTPERKKLSKRGEEAVRNRNLTKDRQYNNGRQRYKKTMVDKIQLRKLNIEQNEPH